MNKASKVKFVLGMIAMSSIAALAPAANAATLKSNPAAFGDILSQAKLNLDSPTQQQATSTSPSLEQLQQVALRKVDVRCDGGGSTNSGGC
jgi:hypothetical protein